MVPPFMGHEKAVQCYFFKYTGMSQCTKAKQKETIEDQEFRIHSFAMNCREFCFLLNLNMERGFHLICVLKQELKHILLTVGCVSYVLFPKMINQITH